MNLTKKRWGVLGACCLINLCLGSVYAWSVFASSMAEYLSIKNGITITTGDLAIVYTVANAVGPITMIAGGWFNDKLGPRKVILVGGFMFGAGMILSSFATSVGFLIITYGLLSGLGLGMAYGTTISSCVKFFPDKRGLIGGVTTAAYGLSSVLLPPIITLIVRISDATFAFRLIGIIFIVIIVACSCYMTQCPGDFIPEGWIRQENKNDAPVSVNKNWKGMLASPEFYIMIVLLTCGAFCGMMIIPHASAIATNMVGMTAMGASTAVSVLALFNALGRIVAGSISDKIGRISTLCIACVLSAVGMICLYFAGISVPLFYIGIAIVGICFGAFMGVFPGFTADQFGIKNNSVNYGIMFIGFAAAGFFGPSVMGHLYIADGSYQKSFLVAMTLSIVGVFITFIYRIVTKKKN